MPALFSSRVEEFIARSPSEIVGLLSIGYALQGFIDQKSDQTESWLADILSLQAALLEAGSRSIRVFDWSVFLEFVIPRKAKRIDVVLLSNTSIMI